MDTLADCCFSSDGVEIISLGNRERLTAAILSQLVTGNFEIFIIFTNIFSHQLQLSICKLDLDKKKRTDLQFANNYLIQEFCFIPAQSPVSAKYEGRNMLIFDHCSVYQSDKRTTARPDLTCEDTGPGPGSVVFLCVSSRLLRAVKCRVE